MNDVLKVSGLSRSFTQGGVTIDVLRGVDPSARRQLDAAEQKAIFAALPRIGMLSLRSCRVGVVAAATTIDRATGQPYYLATVDITQAVDKLADRKLMPGMPVEVYVQTDERTAISYLTKPFTDQMLRAFREE